MPESNESIKPLATTPSELNIHLSYIRDTISDMKTTTAKSLEDMKSQSAKDMQDLKERITEVSEHIVTETEFQPVAALVATHDIAIKELTAYKDTSNGKLAGFFAAASAVGAALSVLIGHYWK